MYSSAEVCLQSSTWRVGLSYPLLYGLRRLAFVLYIARVGLERGRVALDSAEHIFSPLHGEVDWNRATTRRVKPYSFSLSHSEGEIEPNSCRRGRRVSGAFQSSTQRGWLTWMGRLSLRAADRRFQSLYMARWIEHAERKEADIPSLSVLTWRGGIGWHRPCIRGVLVPFSPLHSEGGIGTPDMRAAGSGPPGLSVLYIARVGLEPTSMPCFQRPTANPCCAEQPQMA